MASDRTRHTAPNFMSHKEWPTLAGRLSHPLTSEGEALEQLSKTMELTPLAKKKLEKFRRGLKGKRQSINDVSVETTTEIRKKY